MPKTNKIYISYQGIGLRKSTFSTHPFIYSLCDQLTHVVLPNDLEDKI